MLNLLESRFALYKPRVLKVLMPKCCHVVLILATNSSQNLGADSKHIKQRDLIPGRERLYINFNKIREGPFTKPGQHYLKVSMLSWCHREACQSRWSKG